MPDISRQDRDISRRWHDEHVAPCTRGHRERWFVLQRHANASAFNGYRPQRSDYSLVGCGACGRRWRTKAAYVEALPDADPGIPGEPRPSTAPPARPPRQENRQ
jgi:hypothetical protein